MPIAFRHSSVTRRNAAQDRVHVTLEVESTLSQRYFNTVTHTLCHGARAIIAWHQQWPTLTRPLHCVPCAYHMTRDGMHVHRTRQQIWKELAFDEPLDYEQGYAV